MTTIAIIGGTGPEGRGLGLRLSLAGHPVIIGSRDAARAAQAAHGLLQLRPGLPLSGALNAAAAQEADCAVLAVPYRSMESTLQALVSLLAGKLVISVVVPLTIVKGRPRALVVPQGSAAQQAASLLPNSQVVAAFHHVSAGDLCIPDKKLEADIIVCGDHAGAKERVMALVEQVVSLRAIDGGPLENARYTEELTVLLMQINRTYKADSMIRLIGI